MKEKKIRKEIWITEHRDIMSRKITEIVEAATEIVEMATLASSAAIKGKDITMAAELVKVTLAAKETRKAARRAKIIGGFFVLHKLEKEAEGEPEMSQNNSNDVRSTKKATTVIWDPEKMGPYK